ncbi:MAG: hypothetical protein OEV08_11785, partial [Nitrospira sp.]|nr:hypothetical protein [Nitrospira sp.]
QALDYLRPVLDISAKRLSELDKTEFLRAWFAVGFLHHQLHPDSALSNGTHTSRPKGGGVSDKSDRRLFSPVFNLSGWPVSLVPLAKEARRRLDRGAISLQDYYCSDAYSAGANWNLGEASVRH